MALPTDRVALPDSESVPVLPCCVLSRGRTVFDQCPVFPFAFARAASSGFGERSGIGFIDLFWLPSRFDQGSREDRV